MKLADLTRPQWQAALEAARQLCTGNVHSAEDRAAFRAAKAKLAELLPDGTPVDDIITKTVRWSEMNDIVAELAGIPGIVINREAGVANNAPAAI